MWTTYPSTIHLCIVFICFIDILSVEADDGDAEDELEEADSCFEEGRDDVSGGSSHAAVNEFGLDIHVCRVGELFMSYVDVDVEVGVFLGEFISRVGWSDAAREGSG